MRKKLLFILPWFVMGGIERSFVPMYNALAFHGHDVDICIYRQSPANILPEHASIILPAEAMEREYEVAVSYSHYVPPNVWAPYIQAERKIQWVHTNATIDLLHGRWDDIEHVDHVIVVSQEGLESFIKEFPNFKTRTELVYNIIPNEVIRTLAQQDPQGFFPHDMMNVVTVARIAKQKALDRALIVHKKLLEEGYSFRWYVIGHGEERHDLEKLVHTYKMKDWFILLGEKENPFPYVMQADIFALPSLFEGFGIVVTEAKILGRPILVTDFSGAKEQILSHENGLVVENNECAIYNGLKFLLTHPEEREKYSEALKNFSYDNKPSLQRLRTLFNL